MVLKRSCLFQTLAVGPGPTCGSFSRYLAGFSCCLMVLSSFNWLRQILYGSLCFCSVLDGSGLYQTVEVGSSRPMNCFLKCLFHLDASKNCFLKCLLHLDAS